mgnify:CR=1 FL=1
MSMYQYANVAICQLTAFYSAWQLAYQAHGHIDTLLIGCFEFFQEAGIVFRE